MKKKKVQISVFFSLLALMAVLNSCIKPPAEYPATPHIEFKNYNLFQENDGTYTLKLYMSFTDGDGDLGLGQEDTVAPFNGDSPYYYNLYAKYLAKVQGQFREITPYYPIEVGDTIRYSGRVPVVTPKGKDKSVKGDIEYTLAPLSPDFRYYNTIKFEIFMYDRALHKSNVIETPEIVFQ